MAITKFTTSGINNIRKYADFLAGNPFYDPNPSYLAASTNSGSSYAYDAAADSSGNIYICGTTNDGGTEYTFIAKYDFNFTNLWKRKLNTVNNDIGAKIGLDSSGNVYIAASSKPGGLRIGVVAKYNSSGTIQWQRTLSPATQQLWLSNIAVDSSGNVHVIGLHTDNGSGTSAFLAKYNTSGTIQWQRDWIASSGSQGISVAVDSSGNVFAGGYGNYGSGNIADLIKFNSSGTKQWHRTLSNTATTIINDLACNSSDVYLAGQTFAADYRAFNAKYNSSGSIQWQRSLDGGGSTDYYYGIGIDSAGNSYCVGRMFQTNSLGYIAKYNTSGTIQWQRSLAISGKNIVLNGNAVENDVIYFGGQKTKTNIDSFYGKVPTDGTKTGTYSLDAQSIDYASGTATEAAGGMTDAAGTVTVNTSTKTDAAGSLTDSAWTSTDTKVLL
jgi:hypothetical protein